jgi:pyridoxal phosphate enzyme (YggS family)
MMPESAQDGDWKRRLSENIAATKERIAKAALRASRDPGTVQLVAVSKTVPARAIRIAVELGVTDIGENRIQEAAAKFDELGKIARWHMVGHLQTNKVKKALEIFDIVHSVDSLKLAEEIERRAKEAGKTVEVLIEVNTSGEETKYGIQADELEDLVSGILEKEAVRFAGLMTIGPFVGDPEAARPSFKVLRDLRDRIRGFLPEGQSECRLSMGMTNDFEVAIEEGADIVRIGTAIFGSRR